jgi:hypothetical protein
MSYDLRVWEQPPGQPRPGTLEDVGRTVLALEVKRPGTNPKFITLGERMSARFAAASRSLPVADDAVWSSDPAADARTIEDGVWVLEVPPENRVAVVFFVVETATSLGLSVLDEQLGMAFLPGAVVLPEDKRGFWSDLGRELMENDKKPRATKADVRRAMATFLRESAEKFGFRHDPSNRRVDVAFVRSTPAGVQTIDLRLDGSLPLLKCSIYCRQRNEEVEAIHAAAVGASESTPHTFAFNAGIFKGFFHTGMPFESVKEIKEIFALLEERAIPVLQQSASLSGMNGVLNDAQRHPLEYELGHPSDPPTLADYFHADSLRPLIMAWLTREPRFDSLVDEYRGLIARWRRLDAANLDKVRTYLRDRVKPADPVANDE